MEAFARERAQLLLADRDADGLAAARHRYAKSGITVIVTTVDVTDPSQTKAMIDRCIADLGKVDILVNCAGILTEVPLVDMDVAAWDQMIATNLRSVFLCCRWTAPHMVHRRSGRIMNVASQLGIKGGEGLVHYSASKAGAIAMPTDT